MGFGRQGTVPTFCASEVALRGGLHVRVGDVERDCRANQEGRPSTLHALVSLGIPSQRNDLQQSLLPRLHPRHCHKVPSPKELVSSLSFTNLEMNTVTVDLL
jgi:hypothetical protein